MNALSGLGTLKRVELSSFGTPTFWAITAETGARLVLHAAAADALMALLTAWVKRGRLLHINSMWRSVEEQRLTRLRLGPDIASKPGWSAHPLSLAVDYNTSTNALGGATNAEFQAFAAQYGFHGISTEPWHIGYLNGFDGASQWPNMLAFVTDLAKTSLPITVEGIKNALADLKYGWDREEIRRWQADYGFRETDQNGIPGPQTQMTLALVTMCKAIEPTVMDLCGNG